MSTVLLIIQLIISIILTGLILIQRSEGGALGIGGGGGGGGGLMSGRSATTSIARMTGILGAIFIVNSLALSVVFNMENQDSSIIDDTNAEAPLTSGTESSDTTTPLDEVVTTPELSAETPQDAMDETTTSEATVTADDE